MKGAIKAKKLIEQMKNQSDEENQKRVEELKQ